MKKNSESKKVNMPFIEPKCDFFGYRCFFGLN